MDLSGCLESTRKRVPCRLQPELASKIWPNEITDFLVLHERLHETMCTLEQLQMHAQAGHESCQRHSAAQRPPYRRPKIASVHMSGQDVSPEPIPRDDERHLSLDLAPGINQTQGGPLSWRPGPFQLLQAVRPHWMQATSRPFVIEEGFLRELLCHWQSLQLMHAHHETVCHTPLAACSVAYSARMRGRAELCDGMTTGQLLMGWCHSLASASEQ